MASLTRSPDRTLRGIRRSGHARRAARMLPTGVGIAVLVGGMLPACAQWGGGWGFNRGGYASTAGQAAAYGMSEVLRAQGYQNLQNSEAAKNWEEAKTLEMQNRLRWTETYFDMRKVNREARAAERGPPVTQEQAIRWAWELSTEVFGLAPRNLVVSVFREDDEAEAIAIANDVRYGLQRGHERTGGPEGSPRRHRPHRSRTAAVAERARGLRTESCAYQARGRPRH